MTREQILRSPTYWITYIQNGLFKMVDDYRSKNRLKKKDLANKLGVTKGYVSQILNGDSDHKISKLVELSLACGKVPQIVYSDLEQYIKSDLENNLENKQIVNNIQQNILIIPSTESFAINDSLIKFINSERFHRLANNKISDHYNIIETQTELPKNFINE